MSDDIQGRTSTFKEKRDSNVQNERSSNDTDFAVHTSTSEDFGLKKRGYTLTKLLGQGSYAKVYRAEYADKNGRKTLLACKVINGTDSPTDFLKRFFPREVEIMYRVNHINIVRVHSILQRKHTYFLFMQFCDHSDVLDFIKTQGAIKEKQSRIWFSQLLKGLHYLHERNIAHRDLKCENLLLSYSYNIRISDFGFSRYSVTGEPKSSTFCGSLSYATPEIIKGTPYTPWKADIWSIGVILFVMLNKAMPFDDSSLRTLYHCQMSRSWKFREKIVYTISPEVRSYVYLILDPVSDTRKTTEELWEEAWIRESSDTDLFITGGAPKVSGNQKNMSKKEMKLQERMAEKKEKDLNDERKPVQIMDVDTAIIRNASYFLLETQNEKENQERRASAKSVEVQTRRLDTLSRIESRASTADPDRNKDKDHHKYHF